MLRRVVVDIISVMADESHRPDDGGSNSVNFTNYKTQRPEGIKRELAVRS
jgi:hypothetical protein